MAVRVFSFEGCMHVKGFLILGLSVKVGRRYSVVLLYFHEELSSFNKHLSFLYEMNKSWQTSINLYVL